eukprot:scaffold261_cov318-Chaetoceros_neogracile.AAC.27
MFKYPIISDENTSSGEVGIGGSGADANVEVHSDRDLFAGGYFIIHHNKEQRQYHTKAVAATILSRWMHLKMNGGERGE